MEKETNVEVEIEEVLEVEGYSCSTALRRCAYDCAGSALWTSSN
ncbi:hypothetical protein [Lachnotalea glycerini]|nr:hypothetical protein [Lachnotalea glycerini]